MNSFFNKEENHVIDYISSKGRNITGIKNITKVDPLVSGNINFNTVVTFSINKENGRIPDVKGSKLIWNVSQITNGTGGTFNRFCNSPIIFAFDKIELIHKKNVIRTIPPRAIWNNIKKYASPDEFSEICRRLKFDTASNRNSLSASPQTFSLELKFIDDFFSSQYNLNLMDDFLELKFYLVNNMLNIIQTDHATTLPSFSTSSMYLDLHWIQPRALIYKAIETEYFKSDEKSKMYFNKEYIQINTPIVSGATSVQQFLPDIKGRNVIDIYSVIRLDTLEKSISGLSEYTDTFIHPLSWEIKNNDNFIDGAGRLITFNDYSHSIFPSMDLRGERNYHNGTTISNEIQYSFSHDHSLDSPDKRNYHGHRVFNENAIKFTVNFASLSSAAHIYTLISIPRMMQIQKGVLIDVDSQIN